MSVLPFRGALLLSVAVLAAYAGAFAADFQFDDWNVVVLNPAVHSLAAWADSMPGIRPLLKLSYALNWSLDAAPVGFHAVNVLLHLLNTLLVFRLAALFLAGPDGRLRPAEAGVPLVAGLLFALHPAHTEAVTYVAGRSVSLMTFFYLLGLWVHAEARELAPRAAMWASTFLFACALGVRETAVTFPLALLLWDATARGRRFDARASLRRLWPHALVLAAAVGLMAASPGYRHLLEISLAAREPVAQLLVQVEALWRLLGLGFLVVPPNIDPEIAVPSGVTLAWFGKAAVLAVLLAAGGWALRRAPLAGFAIAWALLHLAPTQSLLPRLDPVNDRHLYLASFGMIVAIAWLLVTALPRVLPLRVARGLPVALILFMGLLTVDRNRDYASERALWEATARLSPGKARVFNNLGLALEREGDVEGARRAYRRALALDPEHIRAQVNLLRLKDGSH